jgi:hypothetical protein
MDRAPRGFPGRPVSVVVVDASIQFTHDVMPAGLLVRLCPEQLLMKVGFAMEFSCPTCDSPAVVFPERLDRHAPVKCQRCAAVLCTLGDFRRYADARAVSRRRPSSISPRRANELPRHPLSGPAPGMSVTNAKAAGA